MNAPNALSQDKIAAERRGYEPSMEEILASIRRIIADDQAVPPRPPTEPTVAVLQPAAAPAPAAVTETSAELPAPDQEEGDLDGWTDIPAAAAAKPVPADEPAAPSLRSSFDFVPGREFRPVPPRPPIAERPVFVRESAAPRVGGESPAERRETSRRLAPGPRPVAQSPVPSNPVPSSPVTADEALVSPATDAMVSHAFNTLIASRFLQSNDVMSEMMREMLRPMLKAWLDDNLPILVERLVRAEIERVARGGR
jgi:uncharacterized protein